MIRKIVVILGNLGVLIFFVVLAIAAQLMAPKTERKVVEPKLPAAFVKEAEFNPIALTVRAQGEVTPRREISLTPQVAGRIEFVSDKFVDGGIIEEGDLLVRIEDADYRLALTRAQARVATAQQSLEVERAEAELARQDFEELNGIAGDAPSALTLRKPQLARAEADFAAAKADLADAQLAVTRTQIRAPFDGRVRSIGANLGQFVSTGLSIGQLFSTDVAEVRLPLTDDDLARLQIPLAFSAPYGEGPEVTFSTVAAGVERTWTGHLVRVAASIDPRTRQIAAIAQVKAPYGAGSDNGFPMAIGLFVTAEIEGPSLDRALLIPRLALQPGDYIYTLNEDDEVQRSPVTVIATTSEGVVITGGVEEGDRIITSRMNVAVGTKIRPLDPSNPGATEPDASATDDATADAGTSADSGQGAN